MAGCEIPLSRSLQSERVAEVITVRKEKTVEAVFAQLSKLSRMENATLKARLRPSKRLSVSSAPSCRDSWVGVDADP